ncbi:MAG: DUF1800 family protein [Betaproteobacteria bacterium]
MENRNRPLQAMGCAFMLALHFAVPAAAADVIEFYNSTLDNYFITADPIEAAAIDNGAAGPGWSRTGDTFGAGGNAAVCRFYGSQSPGPNSHFYTVLADECAALKQLQQTTPASQKRWNFESLDFLSSVPAAGGCFEGTTPVYRAYNDGFARGVDSNHRITRNRNAIAAVVARGWTDEGVVMCAPPSTAEVEADIVRLLEQGTLGPTEALVQEVKGKGIRPWIDEQMALNVTRYTQLPFFDPPPDNSSCINDMTPPITPEKWCTFNNYSAAPVAIEFFRQARTAPDQLRLRMAHVWHQIFVFSNVGVSHAYAHADFQQRLRDNVFGTFENLLLKYALSPQLGVFQNWIHNVPEHDGIRPNENFARELMQLFTIGVNELNDDGTPKLGSGGELTPTYGQSDIETLARVLTGFSFPTMPGKAPGFFGAQTNFFGDMLGFDQFHDQGAKSLLNGRIQLAAGMGALDEVRAAIHGLVLHPNTPQFISRQLIQKTVTSAPTPAYVARVAGVFRDNGSGVRGDLAAVTRAILLDSEARGARRFESRYGRLREPALFWTAMIRALDIGTDGLRPWQFGLESGQPLFGAPTVFNYYPADYTLPGGTVPAPEFGIFTSAEFLNRANQFNDLLYFVDQGNAGVWGPQPFLANAIGTASPALTAFLADAGDAPKLVERLNSLFLHGTMREPMRQSVVTAVNKIAPADVLRRIKMALNLIVVSIDYQVQK